MATLSTALSTPFTVPANGLFAVQVRGGSVRLERENTNGAGWVGVAIITGAADIMNSVTGLRWQAVANEGTPSFQADQ